MEKPCLCITTEQQSQTKPAARAFSFFTEDERRRPKFYQNLVIQEFFPSQCAITARAKNPEKNQKIFEKTIDKTAGL